MTHKISFNTNTCILIQKIYAMSLVNSHMIRNIIIMYNIILSIDTILTVYLAFHYSLVNGRNAMAAHLRAFIYLFKATIGTTRAQVST